MQLVLKIDVFSVLFMHLKNRITHLLWALLLSFVYAVPSVGIAQIIDFSVPVSFHYDGKTMSDVLDDLTNKYGVGFSYSRQIIPIHQRLYCHVEKTPFGEAMETLFSQTQVIYGVIGDQIVLSIDVNKSPIPPDMRSYDDGIDDSLASLDELPRMQYKIIPLALREVSVQYTTSRIAPEVVTYDLHRQVRNAEYKQSAMRAQVTVFPPLHADTDPYSAEPVNLSFNVFAGVNQSVEGIEFGGLANILTDDMKGIQASGIANVVGQDFEGLQAAGLLNVVQNSGSGVQASGLINIAGEGPLMQAAGLINYARGNVHSQVAGLINVARNIHGAQVSGFVNVARNVDVVQIGLFNVADSVGGIPIGLMSFVRKRGYHSLELAGEDAIDYNLNLRLGVRAFYNILHVGVDNDGENWSLGYGFGTSFYLTRRNYLQFELMSRQINEGEQWTRDMNLLTQLKMNYDFALGRNLRVAIGPSINVATSRRFDAESGMYGTQVPRYVMFEHTYDDGFHLPLNVKYWAGLHAGIRFGSADMIPERFDRF